jgi:hypothetical protein
MDQSVMAGLEMLEILAPGRRLARLKDLFQSIIEPLVRAGPTYAKLISITIISLGASDTDMKHRETIVFERCKQLPRMGLNSGSVIIIVCLDYFFRADTVDIQLTLLLTKRI